MKIKAVKLSYTDDEIVDSDSNSLMEELQGLIRYLKEIPAISGIEVAGDTVVTVINNFDFNVNERSVTVEFDERETPREPNPI